MQNMPIEDPSTQSQPAIPPSGGMADLRSFSLTGACTSAFSGAEVFSRSSALSELIVADEDIKCIQNRFLLEALLCCQKKPFKTEV